LIVAGFEDKDFAMKILRFSGFMAAVFFCLAGIAHAASITSSVLTGQSTMPGSALDFSFFGNPTSFPDDNYYFAGTGKGGSQPGVLTDFSQSEGTFEYIDGGQSSNFSTINSPLGTATLTGDLFGPDDVNSDSHHFVTDAVTYTLISVPTFNYSDFYVYVMYNNDPAEGGMIDSQITLTLASSGGTAITEHAQDVTAGPSTESLTTSDFAVFHVTGATSGDLLEVGYVGSGGVYGELGGVSFDQTPEPSTWAMLLGGLGVMAFVGRFRAKLSA
jgi:hypothetical protein